VTEELLPIWKVRLPVMKRGAVYDRRKRSDLHCVEVQILEDRAKKVCVSEWFCGERRSNVGIRKGCEQIGRVTLCRSRSRVWRWKERYHREVLC